MKKSNNKSNKVFVPIIIILAILTIAVIALTVLVRIKGGHSSSAKEQSDTSVVESVDNGTEVDFVEDYKLDDYTSKAADGTQTTTTTGSAKMDDPNGYILPTSNSAELTDADLSGLTAQELTYARNEIYARYGYVFESKELNDYFATKSWYTVNSAATDDSLSDLEKKNAEFIRIYQENNQLKYDVK